MMRDKQDDPLVFNPDMMDDYLKYSKVLCVSRDERKGVKKEREKERKYLNHKCAFIISN